MSDNTVAFNSRIEKALKDKLKLLAAQTGISMQDHFTTALKEYFSKLEKQKSEKNV